MIIKTFLEILMVCGGIVTLIGAIMGIREWWILRKIAELPIEAFPIKKTTFCQLVIDWCHENISHSNTRKPYVTLSYYPHRKWNGFYSSRSHGCVIYVNNHQNVLNVINTVIHEYVHARQKNKGFDSLYERYQQEVGYENNPFEVEARRVARKYEKACLLFVCHQLAEKTA
jgi:hypothetical protein